MPFPFFAVLGLVFVVGLLLSAFLLRLSSKLLGVRRQAAGPPVAVESVTFRRALVLTLLIGAANVLVATGLNLAAQKADLAVPLGVAVALRILLPLLILRVGLPTGWMSPSASICSGASWSSCRGSRLSMPSSSWRTKRSSSPPGTWP